MSRSTGVGWSEVVEAWPYVEAAFHQMFGVDLEQVWRNRSWRWFAVRVRGLLASENCLSAQFREGE